MTPFFLITVTYRPGNRKTTGGLLNLSTTQFDEAWGPLVGVGNHLSVLAPEG